MNDEPHLERALAAWRPVRAIVHARRWRPDTIREGPWAGAGIAAAWPLGQVVAAATNLVLLELIDDTELAQLHRILEHYRDGVGYGPFPRSHPRYYDDNAWIGLDFVQQHLMTGAPGALDRAAAVLAYLRSAEHSDGGVYWVEHPKESRHTCSTAPTGELAARLHLLTGNDEARALAERCARFLTTKLRRDDGIYEDNLRNDDTVGTGVYSYNQGTPVGLDVLLHQITGEAEHLDRAQASARASLAFYAEDDRLWRDAPSFNAIYFRNLLTLDAIAPVHDLRARLAAYTERLWTEARDATGWFTSGGVGAYERGGALDQAGITQLFAMQAIPLDEIHSLC